MINSIIYTLLIAIIGMQSCKTTQPTIIIPPIESPIYKNTDSGVWVTFPVMCTGEKLNDMFFSFDTSDSPFPIIYQDTIFTHL